MIGEKYIYYCPYRDKLYEVDLYSHGHNQLFSVDILIDDGEHLHYTYTKWIYIGEL